MLFIRLNTFIALVAIVTATAVKVNQKRPYYQIGCEIVAHTAKEDAETLHILEYELLAHEFLPLVINYPTPLFTPIVSPFPSIGVAACDVALLSASRLGYQTHIEPFSMKPELENEDAKSRGRY
jgi:hypothetical protein